MNDEKKYLVITKQQMQEMLSVVGVGTECGECFFDEYIQMLERQDHLKNNLSDGKNIAEFFAINLHVLMLFVQSNADTFMELLKTFDFKASMYSMEDIIEAGFHLNIDDT